MILKKAGFCRSIYYYARFIYLLLSSNYLVSVTEKEDFIDNRNRNKYKARSFGRI